VSRKKAELTDNFGKEVTVVVAAKAIPEYGIITRDMLRESTVFKSFLQPDAAISIDDLVGRAAYVPIYAGEQITMTKLIQKDGKPVLDRQVEKRMRAVTLSINNYTGVGRLIRPGNRIDILASPNYDSGGAALFEIKTVVQNVLVLATGKTLQNSVPTHVDRDVLSSIEEEFSAQKRKDLANAAVDASMTSRPDDNYTSITVQLSPEDAEKVLFLAHTFGDQRLYFTLRNSADVAMENLDTTLLDQVFGPNSDYGRSLRRPPPPAPPKPPRFFDSVGGKTIPVR
jgi:pilus assembly protein CpaB